MLKTIKALGLAAVAALAILVQTVAPAAAFERWIDFYNNSESAIYEIHMSHVGTSNWQQDRLGEYILYPGQVVRIDPGWQQGYCMLDIWLVTEDGYSDIFDTINACELTQYDIW